MADDDNLIVAFHMQMQHEEEVFRSILRNNRQEQMKHLLDIAVNIQTSNALMSAQLAVESIPWPTIHLKKIWAKERTAI